MAYNSYLNMT